MTRSGYDAAGTPSAPRMHPIAVGGYRFRGTGRTPLRGYGPYDSNAAPCRGRIGNPGECERARPILPSWPLVANKRISMPGTPRHTTLQN